jgi:hypothetical protein
MENLKDAISDLTPEQNQACAVFPEKRLKYYRLLKSGKIGEIYLKIFKKKLWENHII